MLHIDLELINIVIGPWFELRCQVSPQSSTNNIVILLDSLYMFIFLDQRTVIPPMRRRGEVRVRASTGDIKIRGSKSRHSSKKHCSVRTRIPLSVCYIPSHDEF